MTVYDIAAKLPPIDVLRDRCKALAVLECIVDGAEPHYAYTRAWGDDEAALMNNGTGDEWAVVFTADGAFIRAFAHESAMTPYRDPDHELWPGLLDGIPSAFRPLLDDIVDQYVQFAEDYYEIEVNRKAIEHIVAHRPLTDVVVQALNPDVTAAGLHEEITAIGYPLAAAA
ncbi:hypothetical protein [Micromonospora sediminimaris]|uniref:Uncharacterized protein n=1 Tax=Micromonospora sediminimaris TaxID=547162 RepID=A0A9W5XKI9_9ACTN|nr:hypothetical protein [Micromonospora sediminimaris]GIJ34536.1 hypothetical protein Vse01_36840 [Micromonospora sediminimaris]SFD40050.1 hypothetical protein SAMN05216284_11650 [Micromonospora sediminimaris]